MNVNQIHGGLDFFTTENSEVQTYIRYCGIEYVAPGTLPIRAGAAKHIFKSINFCKNLIAVSINGYSGQGHIHNITDDEVEYLSYSLRKNNSITSINLSKNKIGDRGARWLAEVLKTNQNLKIIDLQYNFIGDKGLSFFIDALRLNYSIEDIKLENQLEYDVTNSVILNRNIMNNLSIIQSAFKRKKEIFRKNGHFNGYREKNWVISTLRDQAIGCYLFYTNKHIPHVLFLAFVIPNINCSSHTISLSGEHQQSSLQSRENNFHTRKYHSENYAKSPLDNINNNNNNINFQEGNIIDKSLQITIVKNGMELIDTGVNMILHVPVYRTMKGYSLQRPSESVPSLSEHAAWFICSQPKLLAQTKEFEYFPQALTDTIQREKNLCSVWGISQHPSNYSSFETLQSLINHYKKKWTVGIYI